MTGSITTSVNAEEYFTTDYKTYYDSNNNVKHCYNCFQKFKGDGNFCSEECKTEFSWHGSLQKEGYIDESKEPPNQEND